MNIIRSHRSLFHKIAVLWLVVLVVSVAMILAYRISAPVGAVASSSKEAGDYLNRLETKSYEFADSLMGRFCSARGTQDYADKTPRSIAVDLEDLLDSEGFEGTLIWLEGPSGEMIYRGEKDGSESPVEIDAAFRQPAEIQNTIVVDNEVYTLVSRTIPGPQPDGESALILTTAIPKTRLYEKFDDLHRFAGFEFPEVRPAGNEPLVSGDTVFVPLYVEGSQPPILAGAEIPRSARLPAGNEWRWELIVLGLLPLISIGILFRLLIRYFGTFADHSEALSRLLRDDKPESEIFRRDTRSIGRYMPELARIFNMAEKSVKEKADLRKLLQRVSMSLNLTDEKGFEERYLNEVIEILLHDIEGCGAAILVFEPSDGLPSIIGRYNLGEDFICGLIDSPTGLDFIRNVARHDSRTSLSHLAQPDENSESLHIFSEYEDVLVYPLRFRSQVVGILVLAVSGMEQRQDVFADIESLFLDVFSLCAYSALLEKEKLVLTDGTRILQETSIAISSTLDLSSVLTVVAHRLTDYAGATYCMILLNANDSGDLEVTSFYSKRRDEVPAPDTSRINQADFPELADIIRGRRAAVLGPTDISELSPAEKSFFRAGAIKNLTILPVSHSATSIGVIVLGEERSAARASVDGEKLSFMQAIASQAASAIENARLYGFVKSKVDQLMVSFNVSSIINSEIDIDSMLNKVLRITGDYLKRRSLAIFLVDEDRRRLKMIALRGHRPLLVDNDVFPISNDSIPGLSVSTGESVSIDDTRLDPRLKTVFPEAFSELAVPIRAGGKTTGVLCAGSARANDFSNVDEEFLRSLAAQISVAMERARLFDLERERSLRLRTVFDVSRKVSETLNLDLVLSLAVSSIREAFGYHLVSIFMVDRGLGKFVVGQQSAMEGMQMPDGFTVDLDQGLLGRAVSSRKTLYCADVKASPHYVQAVDEVRSEVCIPMVAGDKILGVLDVQSAHPGGFQADDIGTLEVLADILAVAIDNSYLFKETTEKAERLGLLDKINTAISTALDLDSFFNVVGRAVADNAGYRWTLLVVPDGDSFVCKARYSPESVGDIYPEPVLELLATRLRTVLSRSEAEFISFEEMSRLGRLEELQPAVEAGIRHLALLPIGQLRRSEAVLVVASSKDDGFSTQELALLNDLAVHLRIAWQNSKLYEKLKTAYNQLQDAQERIIQTEKLRALGEMSSGVVHDFRNILAAILGRVQIITRKLDDSSEASANDFVRNHLEVIEKAASDGSSILSRISEFTKRKPTEAFVNLRVDRIIQDVIELTRPQWHDGAIAAGKEISIDFQRSGTLSMLGSPSELREVFTNMVINSVDAIQDEGRIGISAVRDEGNLIRIEFEDNGQGMDEETRRRIFEPFFTTKGGGGTGLGLSVTYGILSRHGGKIEVDSGTGRGTRFTILLPALGGEMRKPDAQEDDSTGSGRGSILIVDDEENLRDILTEVLESEGYSVHSVSDGSDARELMAEREYDLVISDLALPDFSGWELADEIFARYPNTRIIIATGWGAQVEPGTLSLHHVNGLINKPFQIAEIAKKVDLVLRRSRSELLIEQI
jgi:GAF domain-containing protein/CheY-like chemotaxis protein